MTVIVFDTPEASPVSLRIYDLSGRLVRTLVDEELPRARHHVRWNGRDDGGQTVAAGVYFYRLAAPGVRETKRMVLLK